MRKFFFTLIACLAALAAVDTCFASDARIDNVVDPYGNMFMQYVAPSGAAVNNLIVKNAAASSNPLILAAGSDANISVVIQGKGTGTPVLKDGSGTTVLNTTTVASAADAVNLTSATNAAGLASISNVARSTTTVTLTTSAAHGYAVGDYINVAAVTNPGINGVFKVATVPTSTTLTYTDVISGTIASGADTGTVASYMKFGPSLAPSGADSNVNLNLAPLGTGVVQAQIGGGLTFGPVVVTASSQFSISGLGCSSGGTDDMLMGYTLPANTLKNVGDYVRIIAYGQDAGNTHAATAKLLFGATTAVTTGSITLAANDAIRMSCTIYKTGANTQLIVTDDNYAGTTANIARAIPAAAAVTDTSDIVIQFTGNCGTANELKGQGLIIEVGRVPNN